MGLLDNDKILLRAPEHTDLHDIMRWENLTDHWQASCTLAPYSLRNISNYINSYNADPFAEGQLRMIVEHKQSREAIGIADLYDVEVRHRRANVSILIAPQWQRKHNGLHTLRLLEKYAKEHLLLHQLLAYVPADNLPSLSLFKSAGYSHIATLPEWLANHRGRTDACIWLKKLND